MNSEKLINYEGINKVDTMKEATPVLAKHYNNMYDDIETIETNLTSCQADLDTLEAAVLVEDISEAVTTVLTAADSGKTFFINADTAATNYTLPAPVAGLNFKWLWTADCDNAITITTADTTDTTGDMFVGGVLNCAAANLNTFVEVAADNNKMTFDDNVANSAGGAGQWIEVICTEDAAWFVRGIVNMTSDADGVGSAIFSDVD